MKDELNDCIEIESDRLSRRLTIPRQVNFKLTPEAIARLQDFKFDRRNIELDSRQITDLRYYALLNSSLLNKNNTYQQSGLTFSSCLPIGDRPSSIAIRSKIDLSGRISQEIQQDLWQNSQLLSQVMEVHYWLIEEILRQIPLSTGERLPKRRLNRLSVIVYLSLVVFFTFFVVNQSDPNYLRCFATEGIANLFD